MSRRSSRTIYVGNLPGDIRLREVEDLFYKVRIRIWATNIPTQNANIGYHCDKFFSCNFRYFFGL